MCLICSYTRLLRSQSKTGINIVVTGFHVILTGNYILRYDILKMVIQKALMALDRTHDPCIQSEKLYQSNTEADTLHFYPEKTSMFLDVTGLAMQITTPLYTSYHTTSAF